MYEGDEANVDTSNFLELSSRWIRTLEAWACWQLRIMAKGFEIVVIIVEEGVDLGMESKIIYFPIWC
jgi:hypothetical protein